MLSVYLICVGKLKEKFYKDACAEYVKRLSPYCRLTVVEIPETKLSKDPTLGEITNALAKEGEAIRAKIPPGSRVAALCVEGRMRSSEEIPQMFPVPGRSPASCPPPNSRGSVFFALPPIYSAPMPLGPPTLWAERVT